MITIIGKFTFDNFPILVWQSLLCSLSCNLLFIKNSSIKLCSISLCDSKPKKWIIISCKTSRVSWVRFSYFIINPLNVLLTLKSSQLFYISAPILSIFCNQSFFIDTLDTFFNIKNSIFIIKRWCIAIFLFLNFDKYFLNKSNGFLTMYT